MTRTLQFIVLTGSLFAGALAAPAQADEPERVVREWYRRLSESDVAGLAGLIAPNAVFHTEASGKSQSREEFIAYMEQSQDVLANAEIRHRLQEKDETSITMIVCYDFQPGLTLNQETYRIADGKIVNARQKRLAEDCDGF
ncbi:nuclear transport factor 2 family protein [Mesorhizobium sp. UC22_110]|uniref:nuclear transport factor 2 family protein n=1 Tax=unclassified Mesorhizobium TaxID=325217 RepID=UPI00366F85E6